MEKAPIIGNVCMDMIMVDITDIDCKEGDEVIIFGTIRQLKHLQIQLIPFLMNYFTYFSTVKTSFI